MGKTYIIFPTTNAAMAWEQICKGKKLPGRLIPVPPDLKSGCGLAWVVNWEERDLLFPAIEGLELEYEMIFDVPLDSKEATKWRR